MLKKDTKCILIKKSSAVCRKLLCQRSENVDGIFCKTGRLPRTREGSEEYAGSIKLKGGAELCSAKSIWNIRIDTHQAGT